MKKIAAFRHNYPYSSELEALSAILQLCCPPVRRAEPSYSGQTAGAYLTDQFIAALRCLTLRSFAQVIQNVKMVPPSARRSRQVRDGMPLKSSSSPAGPGTAYVC